MPSVARTSTVALFVLLLVVPAFASEQDELREQAKAMVHKAEILTKTGHVNEAEDLQWGAKKLLKAAEELDRDSSDKDYSDELQKKQKAAEGRKEAVKKKPHPEKSPERKIAMKEKDGSHDKGIARRLEHARLAVDNLNAAGLYELARQAAASAEKLEQVMHEAREKKEKRDGNHDEAIEDLRHEIQQIRQELKSLEERIPRKSSPFNLK